MRKFYIGASDTKYVMMNWNTKTFQEWWDIKLGITENEITNKYIEAGNYYEGKILDYMGVEDRDRQIIVGRLRVNYDGIVGGTVIEVKTHKYGEWKVPKAYIQQCQVEMFAGNFETALIKHYGLIEDEYENYGEIDPLRLSTVIVTRDDDWIENKYLPRLICLSDKLRKGEKIEGNFKGC